MKQTVLVACLCLGILVAIPGIAGGALAHISGTITPTHWEEPQGGWTAEADFGILADTAHIVDAQTQTVTVSGTIGTLPTNSGYWLEIGLVPKTIYDSPDFGFLPYIFNKGVGLLKKPPYWRAFYGW